MYAKLREVFSETLQEDDFSFNMVYIDKVKKVVLKLNSKRKVFLVWSHPCKYPLMTRFEEFDTEKSKEESLQISV